MTVKSKQSFNEDFDKIWAVIDQRVLTDRNASGALALVIAVVLEMFGRMQTQETRQAALLQLIESLTDGPKVEPKH